MNRTELINLLLHKIGYKKKYLEIGLNNPNDNYFNVQCAYKECVDPYTYIECDYSDADTSFDREYVKEHVLTYQMTSDDFFRQNTKKYDVIFIDGLHIAEQVVRDIQNSLVCLNENGYIIVHDCLPICEEHQLEDRQSVTWNGSTWKALPNLSMIDGVTFRIVEMDEGCAIIQKYKDDLDFSKYKASDLEYNEVFTNNRIRNSILHVISPYEFLEIYECVINQNI